MRSSSQEVFYEFQARNFERAEIFRQFSDQAVKEIKSTAGWDADVQVKIEPEAGDGSCYAVSMSVFGLGEPVVVKRGGKSVMAVFRKVKKAVLRQIHRMTEREQGYRRRLGFRNSLAS